MSLSSPRGVKTQCAALTHQDSPTKQARIPPSPAVQGGSWGPGGRCQAWSAPSPPAPSAHTAAGTHFLPDAPHVSQSRPRVKTPLPTAPRRGHPGVGTRSLPRVSRPALTICETRDPRPVSNPGAPSPPTWGGPCLSRRVTFPLRLPHVQATRPAAPATEQGASPR